METVMTKELADTLPYLMEADKRKQVKELRNNDLCIKMSKIAKIVGISRQRVYQILKEEGLPTVSKRDGTTIPLLINKRRLSCVCPVCGKLSSRKYCSNECKNKWNEIPVICSKCGKLFFRNKRQFLSSYRKHNGLLFCSRKCNSKWLVEHYGFNLYPNHRVINIPVKNKNLE
jgi:Helix-turn-helix domain of resolvase